MFDPLMTLLVAKAKAVGLVAGTALATTALVGGGAVATIAVSSDSELPADPAAVEQVELAEGDVLAGTEQSDTPTVPIEPPAEETEETDAVDEAEEEKVRPPLPADFVCDESKNHGQNVSAYARSLEKGPGRGEKVSAVAQSDCGKSAGEAEEADATEEPELGTSSVEEPKADKPAKKAKADKPAKAEKPAKKAKADKPAKAKGKPEGKGGGRG